LVNINSGYRLFASDKSSSIFWLNKTENIFVTISCAELSWIDLFVVLVSMQKNISILSEIEAMLNAKKNHTEKTEYKRGKKPGSGRSDKAGIVIRV